MKILVMKTETRVSEKGVEYTGNEFEQNIASSQSFTKNRLLLLIFGGMLVFPIMVPDRVLPVPLKPIKDRSLLVWDYVTDSHTIRKALAVIFGKTNYTPLGSQIGDGGLPTLAVLNDPTGIVGDIQGNIYIAERRNFRIRKISNGIITTMAGTGIRGFSGDRFSGVFARMNRPEGLDRDQAGNLYVADSFNHRVRKLSPNGIIETVAGTGMEGYAGDGGRAVNAKLAGPMDVKIGPLGHIYILERDNHCVRRVDPAGEITTWAGIGSPGFYGDGGLATRAQLNTPYGIAVDDEGNVYVADSENHRVRKISSDGFITTVAGIGTPGFSGDKAMAIEAELNSPQSLLWTADHSLLIGDEHNNRIRKVSSSGVITTIVGTGEPGFSGDGDLALRAQLNDPEYLWEDATGNLYIADGDNGRIRMVNVDGIITTVAGGGQERS